METQISAFLANLEAEPAYSDSTRLAYKSDLQAFLKYLQKTSDHPPVLDDLNARQVVGFLESERQNGRRQSTLVRRWATLRRFIAFLRQEGILQDNILNLESHLIDKTIEAVPPARAPQCLTSAQIEHLKTAIEISPRLRARRDQAILALLLETGFSVGALVNLNLPDLDLRKRKIHLRIENNLDLWLSLGSAAEPIQRYLQECRPELNPTPDEPALFVSQMGGRISRQGIWQILRYWGTMTNPPIKLSPRLVRHTAALRMLRAGRPLPEIQVLLGHSNPLSTQALLRRLEATNKDA